MCLDFQSCLVRLLKVLLKNGYRKVRQKGSHVFVEDASGKFATVVPIHGNEDLGKGLLMSILNDLDIIVEDLLKMF